MEILQSHVSDVSHVTSLLKNYMVKSKRFLKETSLPDHSEEILAEAALCQLQQCAVLWTLARSYQVTAVKWTETQSLNFITGLA